MEVIHEIEDREKIKILFYSEGWGRGGIETFIMNTIRFIDHNKFQCDVFSTHDWDASFDDEISKYGGKRIVLFKGVKPNLVKRTIASARYWKRVLSRENYQIVHINTMNGMGFLFAKIAEVMDVPIRIVHSHNSDFGRRNRFPKYLAHNLGRLLWSHSSTKNFACSTEAGNYLFSNKPYEIIKNGIDVNRFAYSEVIRKKLRLELRIPFDAFVLGSVGRISDAKNPNYQLLLLSELRNKGVDAYLLLVGDGPLFQSTKLFAEKLGVSAWIRMPGISYDPSGYYSAMDVFTMPSLYEGIGIAPVEALASGLLCICSDRVPLKIATNKLIKIPLDQKNTWVNKLYSAFTVHNFNNRHLGRQIVESAGYDCVSCVARIQNIYESCFTE